LLDILYISDDVPIPFISHKDTGIMQLVCHNQKDAVNTAVVTTATAADDHDDAGKSNALSQNVWLK